MWNGPIECRLFRFDMVKGAVRAPRPGNAPEGAPGAAAPAAAPAGAPRAR
jgi:putative N6-adenine-specific DNA methylase